MVGPPEEKNISGVIERISTLRRGIIVIEGAPSAGKNYLMNAISETTHFAKIDIDTYLERNKGAYAKHILFERLTAAIDDASEQSSAILLCGLCAREILDKIKRPAVFYIYVQWNSFEGHPQHADALRAEEGVVLPGKRKDLNDEVIRYHEKYRPRANADLVFIRIGM